MRFAEESIYHIYNRSFNHNKLFTSKDNYVFFTNKLKQLKTYCDILAYCLMPDHYHLMIHIPEGSEGVALVAAARSSAPGPTASSGRTGSGGRSGGLEAMQILTRKIGTIQSSYTQAINKAKGRTGSLFQPKTKAKVLEGQYLFNCFHYIHQNPFKAKLVKRIEAWPYSSFNEYYLGKEYLCNTRLGRTLIDLPKKSALFYDQSYKTLPDIEPALIND